MKSLIGLKKKINSMPDAPGVYLMKDESGGIIYIGKAKSLKKRLVSYCIRGVSRKTQALVSQAEDIEYRLTPTEAMALLLESRLIHENKPKFNISLRDDKSFPLVRITGEEYPAVSITRKKESGAASYFGPYTSAQLLRQALKIIRRHISFRSCKRLPDRECTYYHIGLCPGCCVGKVGKRRYAKAIGDISLILEGKTDILLEKLSREMQTLSKQEKFEQAAQIRDQINALGSIGQSNAAIGNMAELEDLKDLLGLKHLPERIEAFDISNIKGEDATGSMVSFYRGVADKDSYRRFRIKTVNKIDDYRMLNEVIHRRYLRVLKENLILPDLILIDGGRSHLLTAVRELKNLNIKIPVASIAKAQEHIYSETSTKPLKMRPGSGALNLIRRIRDEAHRFAVSYHHLLRRKKIIGS